MHCLNKQVPKNNNLQNAEKTQKKKNSDRQYKKERVETENGNGIETLAKRRGFFVVPFSPCIG